MRNLLCLFSCVRLYRRTQASGSELLLLQNNGVRGHSRWWCWTLLFLRLLVSSVMNVCFLPKESIDRTMRISYTLQLMNNEFTAIFEHDQGWVTAYSPEIPGANGQGRTIEEATTSLADAIALILRDRREDALRGLPENVTRRMITVVQ